MPIRGAAGMRPSSVSATGGNYNFDGDPNWISGSTYGTGLDFMHSSNPMYEAYYAANPYVNQTYNKTWIDKAFGGLFRTGYDKWLNEMQLNSAQYNAGIVDLQQQNAYNSEVAKAQRMRDAGENPDLLGTGDVSEAASTNPDPQDAQIPDAEGSQVLGIVSQVGMTMVDLIPKTLSFMTSLSQLRGIRMDNDLKELQFGNDAVDFATKFFTEQITPEMYRDAYTKGDFGEILDAAEKDSRYLTDTFLSSDRAKKAFKLAYGTHARSLVAEMSKYKTYEEYEEAREAIHGTRASNYYSDDDETQIELIRCILGPYENFQKLFYENEFIRQYFRDPSLESEAVNTGLEVEKSYNEALDGAAAAQAENAQNRYAAQLYDILKDADDMFASVMQKLDDANKWWSPIAKSLVGIARSQLLSGIHLSLGLRSSSYSNSKTGAEASSTGFHFGF